MMGLSVSPQGFLRTLLNAKCIAAYFHTIESV